ncbi:MAG: hypothetical protein ACOZBX_06835 [Campylobacterota bacterium]
MRLQYTGPKPLISSHGINFDLNKEDKFVYLSIVAELIRALDHEYEEDRRYVYMTSGKPLDNDLILSIIQAKNPSLEEDVLQRQKIVNGEIDEELERARSNKLLCEEERDVLIKNIEMLRAYRISRSLNKTVYYSGIASIAHIVKNGHIDHITSPMYPKFMHVFHSLQGVLSKLHPPIDSSIDIFQEDGHLQIRLNILFRK